MSSSSHEPGPYSRLARWVMANSKLVWGVSALLFVLSCAIGLPPDIDANLLALLPKDEPTAVALRKLVDEEGGANLLTMAFESEDPEALDAALDDLCVELAALDTVQFALHEFDEDLAFRIGLLSFTPSELEQLNVRLQAALAMGPALNPVVAQKLMDMGPVTDRIAKAGESNLFSSGDGSGRVIVRPLGSNMDPKFSEGLITEVEAILAAADLPSKGVENTYMGGGYYNTVTDIRGIRRDIMMTSIASGVMVLLVLMISFRSWRAVALVIPPLVLANVMNLAIAELGIGSLNTYTSFGTAILLGLGIAFAVHLVGRYREERLAGYEVEPAIERAWDITGPPCMTAALTSAAGFLALSVGQFRGFYQMGTVLSVGLMLSLVAILVLLPLLIPLLDPKPAALMGARSDIARSTTSTYSLAPIGLMVATVLTIVVGVANLPGPDDFLYDLSEMRRGGLAYDELTDEEKKLAKDSYSPVVVSYPNRETLVKEHYRLEGLVADGRLPHVERVISIESVLPHDQDARLAQLEKLSELASHKNLRYLPPPIAKPLLRVRGFDPKPLTADDIPASLRALIGASAGTNRLLLFPQGNMWDLRESEALLAELEGVVDKPAGAFLAQGALFRTLKTDMPRISLVAFVLVFLLSAFDLRRVSETLVAMGVLTAGMLWAGVAIRFFGIKLSMINVVGVPILLGIGIDVVIHLLHRLKEEGPGGVRRALNTTGVAASIATITTVASFLSLTQAGHRGVASLGLLVVIGLTVVFLITAMLLPLAMAAGWKVSGQAPADTMQD